MTAPPRYIAHLLPTACVPADRHASYISPSLATEGFIHCSPLALTLDTANRYLAPSAALASVSVLIIDTALAQVFSVATAQVPGGPTTHVSGSGPVKIVWEPAVVPPEHEAKQALGSAAGQVRDGDFPHVYGPIAMESVVEVLTLSKGTVTSRAGSATSEKWVAIPGLEKHLAL